MEIVERTAVVPYSQRQMFDLVADIENYAEFLPWCTSSEVHERTPEKVMASLVLAKGPIRKKFTTINSLKAPEQLEMHLVEGPFSHLYGVWTFAALSEGSTEVHCRLEFDFSSRTLAMIIGPLFGMVANELLDSFCQRAHEVYGDD